MLGNRIRPSHCFHKTGDQSLMLDCTFAWHSRCFGVGPFGSVSARNFDGVSRCACNMSSGFSTLNSPYFLLLLLTG